MIAAIVCGVALLVVYSVYRSICASFNLTWFLMKFGFVAGGLLYVALK